MREVDLECCGALQGSLEPMESLQNLVWLNVCDTELEGSTGSRLCQVIGQAFAIREANIKKGFHNLATLIGNASDNFWFFPKQGYVDWNL